MNITALTTATALRADSNVQCVSVNLLQIPKSKVLSPQVDFLIYEAVQLAIAIDGILAIDGIDESTDDLYAKTYSYHEDYAYLKSQASVLTNEQEKLFPERNKWEMTTIDLLNELMDYVWDNLSFWNEGIGVKWTGRRHGPVNWAWYLTCLPETSVFYKDDKDNYYLYSTARKGH